MAEKPVAAVLGLGETGGAFAAGLKRGGSFSAVVGWDPDFDVARAAQRKSVADRFVNSAAEAARQAAVVFVALRGEPFAETLTAIGPNLRQGAVVCGLLEAHEVANGVAARALPTNVSYLNADPIAWSNAEGPERFTSGAWCVSPTSGAHEDAVAFVAQMGEHLGMEPFFLDAREHDALAAAFRVLPTIVAGALVHTVTAHVGWRETSRVAGIEFREATARIASDAGARQAEIAGGGEHAVRWIDLLIAELTRLREGLQDGRVPEDYVERALDARARWLQQRDLPAQAADLPTLQPERKRSLLRPF
ncbi:MAG TPA: prephenate dehydrogenase/arogenate dehydrogenase family protein [Chloroflexota bacterium]|nr:prephenate dehydrogenase/arogenate dehydrogenase family protein [Chloroflexota bacterium]